MVAARPRGAVRAARGCHLAWRAGPRPDTVHAAGRGRVSPCRPARRPLPGRRGDASRARRPGWPRMAGGEKAVGGPPRQGSFMSFKPTTTTYRPGARTLPGEYYTSEAVLAEERERIFA